MYKALLKFDGQGDTTLSFQAEDEFNLIEQVNEHWWLMQASSGQTGLVPASYLAINKTIKSEILESIDRAIDVIHQNAAKKGGPMTPEERRNLQKLIAHRQNVADDKAVGTEADKNEQKAEDSQIKQENQSRDQPQESVYMELPEQPKRRAPSPPKPDMDRQKSQSVKGRRKAPAPPLSRQISDTENRKKREPSVTSSSSNGDVDSCYRTTQKDVINSIKPANKSQTMQNKDVMSPPKPEVIYVESKCKELHLSAICVPESLNTDLISRVIDQVGLTKEQSRMAVRCVLGGIKESITPLSSLMETMLSSLPQPSKSPERSGPSDELRAILEDISKRKNDSQQRSWALHEDFHAIQDLLSKLLKILAEGDHEMCKQVLKEDDYHYLNDLVVYYQMEPRVGLRILLIQTFGCCCQFGYKFVSQLLCTVLTTELAKELLDTDNITNFLNVALLLTMLFSTGEAPPLHHYARLNEEFINFLFECIERPPIVDEYDQIPDSLVSVLLAFNQHFKDSTDNNILKVMAERTYHTVFTEKILLLINREDDPVAIFDYHKPDPSTVLKMFQDIFSLKETSNIFYTNDLMVLIDIILRQLTNRSHGDKARTQFLSLFYDIISNSNYKEHRHRCNEFGECFTSILVEEENDIADDKYIVRNICSEFEGLFPIFI